MQQQKSSSPNLPLSHPMNSISQNSSSPSHYKAAAVAEEAHLSAHIQSQIKFNVHKSILKFNFPDLNTPFRSSDNKEPTDLKYI